MKNETNTPKVSVVIPLYNKGPQIARALESVMAQSVQDFEVVVVDDASTDGGADIVRRHPDGRIRLLRRDLPGPGGHAARNAGITAAAAPLIAFLDADDAWQPLHLEAILRMRAAFPQAGAYTTARRTVNRSGRVALIDYHGVPDAPWEGIVPDYFSSVIKSTLIATSVVAVPKDVFVEVGTFPEGVPKGGDLEMWFRIAVRYPIAFSRYVGGTWFRDSDNSITDTVEQPADPVILGAIRRAMEGPSVCFELSEKLRGYHDALVVKYAKECLIRERPKAARRRLEVSLSGRGGGLYLLTFIPGRVLGVLIEARRRLLGLT
jgi:glycosyltransferase involved in cell wall biosynthesis